MINLSQENPFIADNRDAILTALGTQLIGQSFYRFDGEHTGCPILEFGDVVTLVDWDGLTRVSFITDYTYEFGGSSTFTNTADTALTTGLKYASAQEQIATESNLRKTSIERSENSIRLYVGEQTQDVQNDLNAQIASLKSTEIQQLADQINFGFTQITDNGEQLAEIKKYIRFIDGNIVLGEDGNELTLKISNDSIVFYQNGDPIATFTGNQLVVNESQFDGRLNLGNFAFIPQTGGNLTFRKVK